MYDVMSNYQLAPEVVRQVAWWVYCLCILFPTALLIALYGLVPKRRRRWCKRHPTKALLVFLGLLTVARQSWAKEIEPPKPIVEFVFKLYLDLNHPEKLHPQGWRIQVESLGEQP